MQIQPRFNVQDVPLQKLNKPIVQASCNFPLGVRITLHLSRDEKIPRKMRIHLTPDEARALATELLATTNSKFV